MSFLECYFFHLLGVCSLKSMQSLLKYPQVNRKFSTYGVGTSQACHLAVIHEALPLPSSVPALVQGLVAALPLQQEKPFACVRLSAVSLSGADARLVRSRSHTGDNFHFY